MKVKLLAKALLNKKASDFGLSGDVFRIDEDNNVAFVSHVTLPLDDYTSDNAKEIDELRDAKPGKYILQTWLPSGEIRNDQFDIKEGETTELEITLPHEGPHEWTSLHALTGQFKQEAVKAAEDIVETNGFVGAPADAPRTYADMAMHPRQGFSLAIVKPEEWPDKAIFSEDKTFDNLYGLFCEDIDLDSALDRFTPYGTIDHPSFEDNDYALFRFGHRGLLRQGEEDQDNYYFGPGTPLDRHFLLQSSEAGANLICMPTPWSTPSGQAEVELLLKKQFDYGVPRISITITDPMINTILGYINMGAVQKAANLITFSKARKMLFDKISYPLTAAVGGYLLIMGFERNRYSEKSDNWQDWIDNLDHWFEWMPDGAILNAALLFKLGKTNNKAAFEALMRAYDRGLPFFTFGLQILIDCMRYFAREGEANAIKRLKVLEGIAYQADPSQIFLTLTFPQQWKA
ncbi:MAG: hypothetical protein R3F48_15570 [Candidatus Zixiibacteriota bacterium]